MYAAPLSLPERSRELSGAMLAELSALATESREPSINGAVFKALAAAPAKLIDGLVVRADGTNWNPGYGAGLYVYRGSAWHMLPSFVPAWTAPTLLNSWANVGGYAAAGYYRDPFGRVHLKGRIQSGLHATVVFTLPAGYRPTELLTLGLWQYDGVLPGYRMGELDVETDGDVVAYGTGTITFLSLDGLSFAAI